MNRRSVRIPLLAFALIGATVADGARAQVLPPKGSESTFEVATWNIKQFGNASDVDTQIANAARVVLESEIDLWAVQEISQRSAFDRLMAELGDEFGSYLGTTSASNGLGIGFIYRKSVVRPRQIREILTSFQDEFAGRPPFQLEATVTLPDTSVVVTMITLHMKAFSDANSYDRRVTASGRLKNHIDFTLPSEPVLVLGDFNDLVDGSITSGRDSPYLNFVSDAANYWFPTEELQSDRRYTWCGTNLSCLSGSTIDHILLSGELFDAYEASSVDHYIEVTSAIHAFVLTTSDHIPAFARFDFATSVGVESAESPAEAAVSMSVYPMPVVPASRVAWSQTEASQTAYLTLYDVLGRSVGGPVALTGPSGDVSWPWPNAAAGVYLVRMWTAAGTALSRTVVMK